MFLDAGGRSTEMAQRSHCPADCFTRWVRRLGSMMVQFLDWPRTWPSWTIVSCGPGANGGWVHWRCVLSDAGYRWAMLQRSSPTGVAGTGRLGSVDRKTDQDGISIIQPRQYQQDDKSLERSRWHWMTNCMLLPEDCEAPGNRLLHMVSHHQVCIDENYALTELGWSGSRRRAV